MSAASPQTPDDASIAPESPKPGFPAFTAFLVVAVIGLGVLTMMLAKENRELKAIVATLSPDRDALKDTEQLSPLTLIARDGSKSDVAFINADRPTLLIVTSTQCSHCEAQMPVWDALVEEVSAGGGGGGGVRVLAIQADALSDADLKPARARFDFVRVPAARSTWLGKIPGTPYTAVISTQGVVRRSWPGEFTAQTFPEIRQALELALTGG